MLFGIFLWVKNSLQGGEVHFGNSGKMAHFAVKKMLSAYAAKHKNYNGE
jgi:hypothetical protein